MRCRGVGDHRAHRRVSRPGARDRPRNRRRCRPCPCLTSRSASSDVQAQLRDRYTALTSTIADTGASPATRADAYGEMGKLFLAAEYFDAAEACFVNAGTLAPADMRWPYFLGHALRRGNRLEEAAAAFTRALAAAAQSRAEPRLAERSCIWPRIGLTRHSNCSTRAQALEPRSGAVLYGLGPCRAGDEGLPEGGDVSRGRADDRAGRPRGFTIRSRWPTAGSATVEQAEAHLRQRGEVDLPPVDPLMAEVAGLLQNAAAYETRGAQALDARDWPEAVTQLSKAIEIAPGNAFTHLNLGTALLHAGQSRARARAVPGGRSPDAVARARALRDRRADGDTWARRGSRSRRSPTP